ncbi:hypothetical protein K438DRAFT_1753501 [Mycena galopus ATCC 62051]|nr:hypothetical protein K438DRAFT_1753501 [Mycena galopus ATCC 62051]
MAWWGVSIGGGGDDDVFWSFSVTYFVILDLGFGVGHGLAGCRHCRRRRRRRVRGVVTQGTSPASKEYFRRWSVVFVYQGAFGHGNDDASGDRAPEPRARIKGLRPHRDDDDDVWRDREPEPMVQVVRRDPRAVRHRHHLRIGNGDGDVLGAQSAQTEGTSGNRESKSNEA